MTLSKYAICGSEKSRFIKNQAAKGLLSSLGLRKPLSKVRILGNILFWMYEMNEIVNKYLLAGDKFMPERHLKQLGFSYRVDSLQKRKEEFKFLKKREIQTIFTKIDLISILVLNMTWLIEILEI